MNFYKLLTQAKENSAQAIVEILDMYKPLLISQSMINGRFNEDLYQENCIVLLKCIKQFQFNNCNEK